MTAQIEATESHGRPDPAAIRTVVVIDRELPKGLAANAAAILSLTLGAHHPALVGAHFTDAAGGQHLGLIPEGLPVLGAVRAELPAIRAAAQPGDLAYLGMLISGRRKAVRAVTGQLGLLR
jgi:Protein of unknown function (DUF2000)